MNLYYLIWVDCILKAQSIPDNKNNWKLYTMVFMSMAMALNLGVLMSILQLHILGYVFYDIKFHIFPGEKLNNTLSFFVLYLAIPIILNYLFIYRNKKYEKLLSEYKYHNGKVFMTYFTTSIVLAIIYAIFNVNR